MPSHTRQPPQEPKMRPRLKAPITAERFVQEFQRVWDRAPLRFRQGRLPRITFSERMSRRNQRNCRSYAEVETKTRHFFFAPEVLLLPKPNRLGLIGHECGHVAFPRAGELGADEASADVFGVEIRYDTRWPAAPDGRPGLQSGRFLNPWR